MPTQYELWPLNFILSAVDPGRETAELSDNPNF